MGRVSQVVTYEVHVLKSGRWELHARYPGDRQPFAVSDAKSLEKLSTVEAVKVVKDIYDTGEGASREHVIYQAGDIPSPKGGWMGRLFDKESAPPPRTEARPREDKAAPAPRREIEPSPKRQDGLEPLDEASPLSGGSGGLGLLPKVIGITFASVAVGALFSALTGYLTREHIYGGTRSNVLFGMFIGVFLFSAITMAKTFIHRSDLENSARAAATARREAEERKKRKDALRPVHGWRPGPAAGPVPTPEVPAAPVVTAALAAQIAASLTEALRQGVRLRGGRYLDIPAVRVPKLSPAAEREALFVMLFLGQALETLKGGVEALSNYSRFGVNLFAAGACEALSRQRGFDDRTGKELLGECIRSLGVKPAQAEMFAARCQEHLLADARYVRMFEAGSNAMNAYLGAGGQGDEGTGFLVQALEKWNAPKGPEEKASLPLTILFTDMVGSTNLTQTRGDAVAQEVVRAHNRIVRDALGRFAGKEIKHTGDGIMASFGTASAGVEAAAGIQEGVRQHNRTHPELPLHLKIGINAGEPIAEDDDLFGTAVQLAARICDKAGADQVFVHETVRGLCAGKAFRFANRGPYALKGVAEPVTLHELVWDDTQPLPPDLPAPDTEGNDGKSPTSSPWS